MVLSEQQFAGGVAQSPQYQLTDHLGTVRGIAQRVGGASSATLVNAVQYDAFGKVTSQSNATNQPHHGFAGRDIEPVGGLTYNRNRYYSTSSGRFISQDPIGFAAGDANLYRYVGNAPTLYSDPSGLEKVNIQGIDIDVTRVGHHVFPVELWKWSGLDPSVLPLADETRVRIGQGNPHNFSKHGSKIGYTGHVKAEFSSRLSAFMSTHDIKDGKLTIAQQRAFLSDFLSHLKSASASAYIRSFNSAVVKGGTPKVESWWMREGYKLDHPVLENLSVVKGVASANKLKSVGKVFIKKGAKYVLAPWIAASVYNNAVAQGVSPQNAAAFAAIEVANPLPIGVEEINNAGRYYQELTEKARLIAQGKADPEDYRDTYWYDMVRNRQLLRELLIQTGGCAPNE
jgi:RHS repeat-associated protein